MEHPFFYRNRARRAAGFTLIEIVVVLMIFSIVIGMAAMITRGITAAQKRSLTATRMAGAEAALLQFVILQKRLPCPADGTLTTGIETARDNVTGCTAQTNGVVPWRALGISEVDATDGWDRRLTYRVFPVLAANNGMDMSWCDPAGTGGTITVGGQAPNTCNTACNSGALNNCTTPSNFIMTRGFPIQNVAGTVVMQQPNTGAAFVLLSHGETGGGARLGSGALSTSTVTDGTEEQKNYADKVVQAYYVDDSLMDTSGATHFDDIVSRPSILNVITKAGLGPRSH